MKKEGDHEVSLNFSDEYQVKRIHNLPCNHRHGVWKISLSITRNKKLNYVGTCYVESTEIINLYTN